MRDYKNVFSTGETTEDEQETGAMPRRVRDFVRCTDPECWINKDWMRAARHHGWGDRHKQRPHCHPVY